MPATVTAPPHGNDTKSKGPQLVVPFTRAAKEHEENFLDTTKPLGAGTTQLAPVDVPAYGFIRGVFLEVQATGGASGVACDFAADGPWSVLDNLAIIDVNGAPIFGPFTGYETKVVNKLGGYRKLPNPDRHPKFTTDTATGNFTFLLYIPIEVNGRDALGALANMNAASMYKLQASIAPSAAVYDTAPDTTLPNIRIRAWLDAWTQPPATDLQGHPCAEVPPAHGTTAYWSKTTFNLAAGIANARLPRVGNYIRNLVYIVRDAATGQRIDAMPDPFDVYLDTRLYKSHSNMVWTGELAERYGLTGATLDNPDALERGVFVDDFCHEFDGKAGFELRDGWLATTQSFRIDVTGNYAQGSTLTVLTNDVSPAGEVFV